MDLSAPLPLPRADWTARGTSVHDFPEDFALENGNYQCECVGCGVTFLGYKRRCVCKACEASSRAAFEAMTPEEQEALRLRNLAIVATIFPPHNIITNETLESTTLVQDPARTRPHPQKVG